jgi:hypothetical protein
MTPDQSRNINWLGIFIWMILFWVLIPFNVIKRYPIVLIGYFYTIFILLMNIFLVGNYDDKKQGSDFATNTVDLMSYINEKAIHVSTATFAIALVSREVFKINFYKELLIFMIYTLIFGVGIILPIYFISNQKNNDVIYKNNEIIARIRNISLSYSVGFMISTFIMALNRIYKLY